MNVQLHQLGQGFAVVLTDHKLLDQDSDSSYLSRCLDPLSRLKLRVRHCSEANIMNRHTSDAGRDHSRPFRFLELPGEIRISIIEHALEHESESYGAIGATGAPWRRVDLSASGTEDDEMVILLQPPSWAVAGLLLCNRQISRETQSAIRRYRTKTTECKARAMEVHAAEGGDVYYVTWKGPAWQRYGDWLSPAHSLEELYLGGHLPVDPHAYGEARFIRQERRALDAAAAAEVSQTWGQLDFRPNYLPGPERPTDVVARALMAAEAFLRRQRSGILIGKILIDLTRSPEVNSVTLSVPRGTEQVGPASLRARRWMTDCAHQFLAVTTQTCRGFNEIQVDCKDGIGYWAVLANFNIMMTDHLKQVSTSWGVKKLRSDDPSDSGVINLSSHYEV